MARRAAAGGRGIRRQKGIRMDSLITRIKERAADPLRAVDAATWVCPMPTVAPPATHAEVDAAEAALGFAIPPLLRRLYAEVGNGGFGPGYGLEGVPRIPPVPDRADVVALYEMYNSGPPPDDPGHVWPRGWVPLISGGCLSMECVNFLEPPYRVRRYDGNAGKWGRPIDEWFEPVAVSLEARLESWLVDSGRG
jgi:hypothetical protein